MLLVPWMFVGVFAALYTLLLVPRLREGHALTLAFGLFVGLVLVVFAVAAVAFTRDVLRGHWP